MFLFSSFPTSSKAVDFVMFVLLNETQKMKPSL